MADFQTKVNITPAIGVHGAYASINPIVSTALGKIAAENCPIGGFVWLDADDENKVKPSGEGKPLGFVVREVTNTIVDAKATAQDFVPAGGNVSVQVKGDFFVVVAEAVTKGDAVCANAETGAVTTDGEETDFVFATTAAEGETAIISSK